MFTQKIPKIFYGGQGNVLRSNKNEYEIKGNRIVEPKTFDDFYLFIRRGFLLANDPRIKSFRETGMKKQTDEDILALVRAQRKGEGGEEKKFNKYEMISEIKNKAYNEFFAKIKKEIDDGKREGYPGNLQEMAHSYVEQAIAAFENKDDESDEINDDESDKVNDVLDKDPETKAPEDEDLKIKPSNKKTNIDAELTLNVSADNK